MTRDDYLQWVRTVSNQLASIKYPDNTQQQYQYQLGLVQRALADLCYMDSHNMHKVNAMFTRNIPNNTVKPFRPKR
jgi:hypothetical protein